MVASSKGLRLTRMHTDLLVKFGGKKSLLDIAYLKNELVDAISRRYEERLRLQPQSMLLSKWPLKIARLICSMP
jgi:hypothetical protein